MAEELATHSIAGIARLAEHQHGVVCARQLYALGFSKDQVSDRAAAGWLHRLHRGVYAVGHLRLTLRGYWMAGVLAGGVGAVLSHQAAGELWKIRQSRGDRPPAWIDITVASADGARTRAGLRVHRSRTLGGDETTVRAGIPVTTPARTILDLATILPRRQLERAVDEAELVRLCRQEDLDAIVERHRGQPGTGALQILLESHHAGSTATRSELEELFLKLCRSHHFPQPEVNVPLLDYIVDFLWRAEKLVVEVDGRATHGTRRAFQADRDRDGRLAVAGYRVVRFTWWDVTRRPAVVADRVRRMLAGAA